MGDIKLRRDFDHFNKGESYILHSHSRENPVIPPILPVRKILVCVPLLHRIAQMLDFQTEKALAVVKSRINHHTRQILNASLHALKKLPVPFAQGCLKAEIISNKDSYLNYVVEGLYQKGSP